MNRRLAVIMRVLEEARDRGEFLGSCAVLVPGVWRQEIVRAMGGNSAQRALVMGVPLWFCSERAPIVVRRSLPGHSPRRTSPGG